MKRYIDIVFDGPPSHESGRFVEIENHEGKSIRFGKWVQRDDGFWVLRIPDVRELRGALHYMLWWADRGLRPDAETDPHARFRYDEIVEDAHRAFEESS